MKLIGRWRLIFTTGPAFFARELKWRDDVTVMPRETFYPYNWHQKPTSPVVDLRHASLALFVEFAHGRTTSQFAPSSAVAVHDFTPFVTNFSLIIGIHCTVGTGFGLSGAKCYAAQNIICTQTVHGLKMYLSGEDGSVTPDIALQGTYEFREEMFIKRVFGRVIG